MIFRSRGTGKTTIILEAFITDVCKPQSLVLAPTREIAVQIEQTLTAIGSFIPGRFCLTRGITGLTSKHDITV